MKRWARGHQSLPDVFKEKKEDHVCFLMVCQNRVRLGRRTGKIEHASEGSETKSRAGASQSYVDRDDESLPRNSFACRRKNSIAPKAAKKATKEREIAWCRQKNRIANGTGRDSNFHTEAGEGTVIELHGMSTVSTCSSLCSSASFQCQEEEHSIWNSVVGLYCHYHGGQYIEEILTEEMGRIALHWRFALDL